MTTSAMSLGNFSVSLAVKDLATSRAFYQKLGFEVRGGNGRNFAILQSGTTTLGLFQGAFERNILTFNPGWDAACNKLPDFTDVRELQRRIRAAGIEPVSAADESTTGPASFVLVDPDGNQILVDQHV
jgi:catechol 2,3-dioxygenase-like lactoylglutathione lyase family enzyme